METKFNGLKVGGLALGIIGTILAAFDVFYAIAVYENFSLVENNFILASIIGDAPDHIIRITYVTISIFDLLASALLIAGILMKSRYMLLPWIISSAITILITCVELANLLIPAVLLVALFGLILLIWYSMFLLYRQMKAEKEAQPGVQMAYIDENTSQLPPYSVFKIEKETNVP